MSIGAHTVYAHAELWRANAVRRIARVTSRNGIRFIVQNVVYMCSGSNIIIHTKGDD